MSNQSIKAIDAIQEAQKIAFAPFVFQAVVALRKLGVFQLIFDRRSKGGITLEELSEKLDISDYGIGVLLEISESSEIVSQSETGHYELTTTGYFLAFNETVNVNINFTNEVCYKGLFHLDEAIKTGKPEGLKELGAWKTIYEGLSKLTPLQQKSWFEFDHHYSDDIFSDAVKFVFEKDRKNIFDIGANTGKFTIKCCQSNDAAHMTMIDLPGQLNKALKNVKDAGFENRVTGHEIDWLSENPQIPTGADTIWMSQFLDCFSKGEIYKVLKTCVDAMDDDAELIIVETFTDRQKFDNAKFILEATSIYFTALANGNSKMYKATEFMDIAAAAGLELQEDIAFGEYHTMLTFNKK
ncbi:methyltransferase domain-containing protein [Tamlana haliotis]|uniref:Methyltransferase domain-containing protein n=1 Tax=Pseudotamlana haliotis TaxID=2614804 RepID=A0A6N6MHN1_9FLAO|nr:class I SAM-dependent methyltransferase [Tamlana haliotis]KAB1069021.1 methyltransferase domain-containing protein [Tamlana haliotis]